MSVRRIFPGKDEHTVRHVRLETGQRVVLHGDADDPYFKALPRAARSAGQLQRVASAAVAHAEPGLVLDIGANIGLTALALMHAIGQPVYAMEPHPRTFGLLRETLEANHADQVTALRCAMSDHRGQVHLFADANLSASHVVEEATLAREGTAAAPALTVDTLVRDPSSRVAFMKIDAEGAEPAILKGAEQTLARDRPAVFLEFNMFTLMAVLGENPRTFLEALLARFEIVYRFEGGKPYPIASQADALGFLHHTLTERRGCADLLATFNPL